MKNLILEDYLTEANLQIVLNHIFPEKEFVRNKCVPNSNIRNRPDFRCDELMLIVEFNGIRHYTNAYTIHNDMKKRETYENMGYTVIDIPYFVQLDKYTIGWYFYDFDYVDCVDSTFSHGFIEEKIVFPADYNTIGLERFNYECQNLPKCITDQILDSLARRCIFDSKSAYGYTDIIPNSLFNSKFAFIIAQNSFFIDLNVMINELENPIQYSSWKEFICSNNYFKDVLEMGLSLNNEHGYQGGLDEIIYMHIENFLDVNLNTPVSKDYNYPDYHGLLCKINREHENYIGTVETNTSDMIIH